MSAMATGSLEAYALPSTKCAGGESSPSQGAEAVLLSSDVASDPRELIAGEVRRS
jgi:hypothetical protein